MYHAYINGNLMMAAEDSTFHENRNFGIGYNENSKLFKQHKDYLEGTEK